MSAPNTVFLIDGSAYIYRAYHAITPLSTKNGIPTHAAYGFTNILLRVIREKSPGYLAVAFDAKGPNFRHEMYGDYKANRPSMPEDLSPQIPYIKQIVAAYNICSLEMEGVEADDLIATAARAFEKKGIPVVVVTGDKDLLQLVSDTTTIWDPMSDKVMDPQAVLKKFNVTPAQLTDFFALVGDKSDNIPGVPGVGNKTAEKLINEFGTLEQLYADIERAGKGKIREKLSENREQAFLSRDLVRLRQDLDITLSPEEYRLLEPDFEKLRELFKTLEFTRLVKSELPGQKLDRQCFSLVRTDEELADLVKILQGAEIVVLDTETTSLDTLTADLVGLSLCVDAKQAFYIPLAHRSNDDNSLAKGQLHLDSVLAALRSVFESSSVPKLGHNLKFDSAVLQNKGICLRGPLWDTMIASYLLDPSRRSHKLDDLSEEFLERRLTSFAEVTNKDKRSDCFAYVSLEDAMNYSCEDVIAAYLLWDAFRPQLESQGLWALFADVEMALVPLLAEMERTGILVDPNELKEMSNEFAGHIARLEERIFQLAGRSFNVGSPKQLGEILFDVLELPHGRKTKTGYSTDIKVLEKLRNFHELPGAVIEYRMLSKLKSTYVDKLASLVHPRTGRVHSSFNQTVTATGRLSSSNPNLQNIPIRTEEGQRIRQAFVPAPDQLFLAADYSQIDLRVLAHYSQDAALLKAFRNGEDIHTLTAAEIFMVNPALITKNMRRVAKTINFGIVYGMSAYGLAGQLNLSRKEARTFIERYFEHYAGVKRFMEEIVEQAREDGYVTTLLNRRRWLPDIKSSSKTRREFAERTAINTPIQGTAADIIKLATIEADRRLKKNGLNVKLLLQIHDELVFEVPEKELDRTAAIVKEAMESVLALDVPLIVNISHGQNLAET